MVDALITAEERHTMNRNLTRKAQFSWVSIAPVVSSGSRRPGKRPMASLYPLLDRECLKCRKLFLSTGPGNRICRPCDYKNRDVDHHPTKSVDSHGIGNDFELSSMRDSDL
jgi:hypothetical protein